VRAKNKTREERLLRSAIPATDSAALRRMKWPEGHQRTNGLHAILFPVSEGEGKKYTRDGWPGGVNDNGC